MVFHPISLITSHSYSSSCRWWCGKFIFFFLHTIIYMCHIITLTIIHPCIFILSSCGWWCNSSCLLLLAHHPLHISFHFFIIISHHVSLHTHKTTSSNLAGLCVFQLLITTLLFPFNLHMPLITTFSSGPWLCWSLITAFSLVQ